MRMRSEISRHFVPVEEIRRFTEGSYEHLIARLSEVVQKDRKRLFGEDDLSVRVLGTFKEHAIVAGGNGTFVRVRFEASERGEPSLVGVEPIAVEVFESSDIHRYVNREALRVVDALLSGAATEAGERLRSIVPLVGKTKARTESQVVEGVLADLRADRPWKRLYEERAPRLKFFLGEAVVQTLEGHRATPKFGKLLDMAEAEVEGYRDLVLSDLQFLAERLLVLHGQASDNLEALGQIDASGEEGGPEALTALVHFTNDFVEDLRVAHRVAAEVPNHVHNVGALGRVYDTITEQLHQYEVAGAFVAGMAAKLQTASP